MQNRFNRQAAFTLVETMVAIALVALIGSSLVGMMVLSGKMTRAAREQLTAAEIMEAKIDALRSCTWAQLKQTNFVLPTFTVTNGIVYSGTISNGTPTGSESYVSNLLEISIAVNWLTDGRERTLTSRTFISKDGFSGE